MPETATRATLISKWRLWLCALVLLAGCGTSGPGPGMQALDDSDARIATLRADILTLGPGIDPSEADRAAEIAIRYPMELRLRYRVSDPPILHNMKVNSGLRPRGLCFHWADDLQKRLTEERFETLDLHRAIANSGQVFRIEHSTVLVSSKGAEWDDSLVLDPWRYGGRLYWGPPAADESYAWQARDQVFAEKRAAAR